MRGGYNSNGPNSFCNCLAKAHKYREISKLPATRFELVTIRV